ncbi:HMG-I and HMG-Y, DNA-binding protein [Nostoc carneum NIES-2107]|nr:HMG-I and HMG-Y, DNA-binding protein [Nostoc carneum NIES-2107]
MVKDLFVNDLIEWIVYDNAHVVERIIWIDEGYIIAFVIDINAKKGLPEPKKISDILEAISEGVAFKQQQDPWARIIRDENLTDREKEYRDKAWEIISSLVIEEPSIYYRNFRGLLVKKIVENYNEERDKNKLVEKTVYGYLRRF